MPQAAKRLAHRQRIKPVGSLPAKLRYEHSSFLRCVVRRRGIGWFCLLDADLSGDGFPFRKHAQRRSTYRRQPTPAPAPATTSPTPPTGATPTASSQTARIACPTGTAGSAKQSVSRTSSAQTSCGASAFADDFGRALKPTPELFPAPLGLGTVKLLANEKAAPSPGAAL